MTKPWLWAGPVGNLWRATPDIQDCWDCKRTWGGGGLIQILDLMDGIESYSGPGHWNDPDMLEVGNGGMTTEEYRTHFSMWAIFSAPLLAGNDIAKMSAETREILLNKEVIAIDQDALGQQGHRGAQEERRCRDTSKQLADGGRAVALVNRGKAAEKVTVTWNDIGYPDGLSATVRNLWTHKDTTAKESFTAEVPSLWNSDGKAEVLMVLIKRPSASRQTASYFFHRLEFRTRVAMPAVPRG